MKQNEITGIQHLRAIAALAVVFDHSAAMANLPHYYGEKVFGYNYLIQGALGVDLFFLISGFIITISSLRPGTLEPRVTAKDFFWKRFNRIIPLMWIAIISHAILRFVGRGDIEIAGYLRAIFLWPIGDLEPNVIWTLRQEAVFYIVFALTFFGYRALRVLMIFWIVSGFLFYILSRFGVVDLSASVWEGVFFTVAHPANIQFGIGLAFGIVWSHFNKPTVQVPFHLFWIIAYFVISIYIMTILDVNVARLPDSFISALIFMPLLVLATVGTSMTKSRVWLLLGSASYTIYLFHSHFLSALLGVAVKIYPNAILEIIVPLFGILSVILSLLVYALVERPLVKFLGGRSHSRSIART